MPPARSTARARTQTAPVARPRPRALAGGARGIRWDRVGRIGLLLVLFGVVALYIGPSVRWFETWQESKQRRAEVQTLQQRNRDLRTRRAALRDPRTLEREARRLGLVRPGERPFIIRGLPGDSP